MAQCSCSALKVMVARPAPATHELCSSPGFDGCPVYCGAPAPDGAQVRCPYLDEAAMQYCSAAAVPKYIRPTHALLSRCGDDRHRYCDVFLALATAGRSREPHVDRISVPDHLWYAPNHMWIDPGDNGTCFVGIDAFLAAVLGRVERIRFPNPAGVRRPTAVITVRGVDLEFVFPHPLLINTVHNYLRVNLPALTRDPYGQGWLFECRQADLTGLLHGETALAWMHAEVSHLSDYVHSHLIPPGLPADGGAFADGLMENLSRTEILALRDRFFPSGTETHS